MLKQAQEKVLAHCGDLDQEAMQQCKLYVGLIMKANDEQDDGVVRAAFMEAMGSDVDQRKACKMVVRSVNRYMKNKAKDPNSGMKVQNNGEITYSMAKLENGEMRAVTA